jgi:hypothetical protein
MHSDESIPPMADCPFNFVSRSLIAQFHSKDCQARVDASAAIVSVLRDTPVHSVNVTGSCSARLLLKATPWL